MEIDKLEQNEEAITATKIVYVVLVTSMKQTAILSRQLQMKIYSEFWRDFGDQMSIDSSPSRNLRTTQFPFINLQ